MESSPLLENGTSQRQTRYGAVVGVSIGFLMLFLAYNSLQNYATSLLPGNLGAESLAVLYVSVCIFVFSAPHIAARLREKWTMVLGAVCYLVYMASMLHIIRAVVLGAAVVIGFGAAVLWVAVGSYITKIANPDELGKVNGMFWGIFQFSGIFGNLGAFLIFRHLGGSQALFIAFTAAGTVGVLILLFIPTVLQPKDTQDNGATIQDDELAQRSQVTVQEELRATCNNLLTNEQLALAYMVMFTGLELAFWTGEFPQLLPEHSIGIVLTFAGVGEVIGAAGLSRLSDTFGITPLVVFGALIYAVGLGLTCYLKHTGLPGPEPAWFDVSYIAYLAALCFGLADSTLNTQCYSLIGKVFANRDATRAFTVFQLYQNIGSAGGYYLTIPLPMHGEDGSYGQAYIQAYLLFFGTIAMVMTDLRGKHRKRT